MSKVTDQIPVPRKRGGRALTYPELETMEVGESFAVKASGDIIGPMIYHYGLRWDKRFVYKTEKDGRIRIWREA